MYLTIVVIVLGLRSIEGQTGDFTINKVTLSSVPSTSLKNGDSLVLKCDVMFAKTTDFVLNSVISFYRDDKKIYTASSTEDGVSYTIQKVQASHTGTYKCEVFVAGRMKTSNDVNIKVTGASSPLINVSKNEVSEGDHVTVRCEAPEEWSTMMFNFHKNNQHVKEVKHKLGDPNHAEVNFTIKQGEEFLQFKCDFELLLIKETSLPSALISVTVVAPFSIPRIEVLPSFNFTEGKNMSVKCSVTEGLQGLGDMKVTLQKDGHIINSSTTNTLSYFRVATVDDMGNYTCKVESQRTSKSNSVKIDIAELFPRPNITLMRTSKNQYINEGDRLNLKCSVEGLGPAASDLDYKFILDKGKKTFTRRGGKLVMTASEIFSGSYVCQVSISNIIKISEPLDIQVYAPVKNPVLTHIMKSNSTLVLGDTLELTCKCQSGTPPITYSLLRGNDLVMGKTMQENMEVRFLVNSSNELGQYRCLATNRNTQSTGKYSNIVNVTVIIPISRVELNTIQATGDVEEGSELSLICRVENGTLPINFQFYKKKGNDILLHNVTETKNLYTTHMLLTFSKQDDGTYSCMASNRATNRVESNFIVARAVLASWKKAVIGTFVLLIILAAIAICAYLHMDKKKKGKDITTEKNRSSKPVTAKKEKSSVEMKGGESYFGNVENEDEIHMLKAAEENTGNSQKKHEVEHTQAQNASPDAHQDTDENNVNRTEDDPEANNHP